MDSLTAPLSLSASFYHVYAKHIELERDEKDVSGLSFQTSVNEHVRALLMLWHSVKLAALFSENELLEDLPTSSLKYLLLPALIAESYYKSLDTSRMHALEQSKKYADEFLLLSTAYQIQIPTAPTSTSQSVAEEKRYLKIWKFKEQKRLDHDLQWLLKRYEKPWPSKDSHPYDDEKEDDIEGYRDASVEWIQLFQLKLTDLLLAVNDELQLLALKLRIENQDEPAPMPRPSSSTLGRPFTLLPSKRPSSSLSPSLLSSSTTFERQRLQSAVFGPGYNLPTMTIDEWLDKEMAMGNFLSSANDASEEKSDQEDRDRDPDSEAQLAKDRAWDIFKDENKRGWGNRMRQS